MKHTLDDGQLEIFEKKNKMMNKENWTVIYMYAVGERSKFGDLCKSRRKKTISIPRVISIGKFIGKIFTNNVIFLYFYLMPVSFIGIALNKELNKQNIVKCQKRKTKKKKLASYNANWKKREKQIENE